MRMLKPVNCFTKKCFSLLWLFLVASCASISSIPEDKYFPLTIQTPIPLTAPFPVNAVIAVERFQSETLYEDRSIVYSLAKQPGELLQYHYHHWTESLPSLVQTRLIDFLRQANFAAYVVYEGYSSYPDYVISGQIKSFVYVINKERGRVDVSLVFQIQKDLQPVFLKEYDKSVEIIPPGIYRASEGFGNAVYQIFETFVVDASGLFNE